LPPSVTLDGTHTAMIQVMITTTAPNAARAALRREASHSGRCRTRTHSLDSERDEVGCVGSQRCSNAAGNEPLDASFPHEEARYRPERGFKL
jgi:hypothetical protein